MNYACGFDQSETGKYFELVINLILPHCHVPVLKVKENLLKSRKITLNRIVKYILRGPKTINSP